MLTGRVDASYLMQQLFVDCHTQTGHSVCHVLAEIIVGCKHLLLIPVRHHRPYNWCLGNIGKVTSLQIAFTSQVAAGKMGSGPSHSLLLPLSRHYAAPLVFDDTTLSS